MRIYFASREHRDFYHDMMAQSRRQDCYHQALFLCDGDCTGNTSKHPTDV